MSSAPGDRNRESLRRTVTNLFDAVRFSQDMRLWEARAEQVSKAAEEEIGKLQEFMKRSTEGATRLSDSIGQLYAKELADQVSEFVRAAGERACARAESESSLKLSEINEEVKSQKTKTLKNLESYFGDQPLPLVESVVWVKLEHTGYRAEASYSCKGDIGYAFTLGTQNSRFFRAYRLADAGKRLEIPVALSKSWLKKDPTPRYERLDRYALTSAELSGQHLIAEFNEDGTQNRIRVSGSSAGDDGFTTVEFMEGHSTINVTSDAGLNRFIDTAALKEAVNQIRADLVLLEKNKVALTELTSSGRNLLETLDCADLLMRVLDLMGPTYRGLIERGAPAPSKAARASELTAPYIRERLVRLGSVAPMVEAALALKG